MILDKSKSDVNVMFYSHIYLQHNSLRFTGGVPCTNRTADKVYIKQKSLALGLFRPNQINGTGSEEMEGVYCIGSLFHNVNIVSLQK